MACLFVSCSSEEQPPEKVFQEKTSRETIDPLKPQMPDQTEEIQNNIRASIERMIRSNNLKIGDVWIAATAIIPGFYKRRDFKPAWNDTDKINGLMRAIDEIEMDGLIGDDYNRRQLEELSEAIEMQTPPEPLLLAYRDLLLTDALVLLGYHLNYGKVDPLRRVPIWNMTAKLQRQDPVTLIQQAIDSGAFYEFIAGLKPRDEIYEQLKAALARYQDIKNDGGWQPIPAGSTLKKGMEDDRIIHLRRRLQATGDLAEIDSGTSTIFDNELEKAVRHFQQRYGLMPDGVVGKNTLEALNVPVEARVDQIRVNLERVRWVLHEDLDTFILVNIPGFKIYYIQNEEEIWAGGIQVGTPFRQAPVFRADMTSLEFNPTWTVPPAILAEDILPAVKQDPNYLKKRDIHVIDRNGKIVDPKSINWSKYSESNFPYQLRQEPGSSNVLGQIKFMFLNEHLMYLHDTPGENLFEQESGTFSSGCTRIENPFELAQLLLGDEWSADRIDQVLRTKKTTTVKLAKPVPVILFYLTALPDFDGRIHFRNDVYGRDQALLEALNAEFKPKGQSVKKPSE